MKIVLSVIITFLFFQLAYGQEAFYVLHVRGKVTDSEKQEITPRDKLTPKDQLVFSSEDDFIIVFSSTTGRKIIKPVNKVEETKNFVSYFLEENIFPLRQEISTRSLGNSVRSLEELAEKFQKSFLVIDRYDIPVNPGELGLSDDVYLEVKDQMKLPMTDSSIVITSELATGTYELYQVDENFNMKNLFGYLKVTRKDTAQLKAEIAFYEDITGETLNKNELKEYLEKTLGVISENDLNLLVN